MKITDAKEIAEDENLDLSLRPKLLKEFIGQDKIKKNVDILIKGDG